MTDFSAVKVDSLLKVEKASLAPSLKIGGDKKIFNVGGDMVINQVYSGTVGPQNPDLLMQESQVLIESNGKIDDISNLELVLSPFMGVVKSPSFNGTRVQLEFTLTNSNDIPKTIKGTYLDLNRGTVHFKLFFSVDDSGFRKPDLTTRLPIVVNSRGVARVAAEFENVDHALIDKGQLEGELFVQIGDIRVVSKKFKFEVNDAMVNTLSELQKAADENNSPILFDARITS